MYRSLQVHLGTRSENCRKEAASELLAISKVTADPAEYAHTRAGVLAMRAAARFKESRTLLQTVFQPAVDSVLAERLVSSTLAGPSTASSFIQLAQCAGGTQPVNTVRGLARLYSSAARRNVGVSNVSIGPSQQARHRSPLAVAALLTSALPVHSDCAQRTSLGTSR